MGWHQVGQRRADVQCSRCLLTSLRRRPESVYVEDHPDLQDGMATKWPSETIEEIVLQTMKAAGTETLVTFDEVSPSQYFHHSALLWAHDEWQRHVVHMLADVDKCALHPSSTACRVTSTTLR